LTGVGITPVPWKEEGEVNDPRISTEEAGLFVAALQRKEASDAALWCAAFAGSGMRKSRHSGAELSG